MRDAFDDDPSLPGVLAMIAAAAHTIDLELFRFWKGHSSGLCIRALAERAQTGVRVRVIFDSPTSEKIDAGEALPLTQSGVEIAGCHLLPRNAYAAAASRARREMLIADGTVALVSGTGNSDARSTTLHSRSGLFNPYYRVWGSVAAQLQAEFTGHWLKLCDAQPKAAGTDPRSRRRWIW